jgi:hypothetical protein
VLNITKQKRRKVMDNKISIILPSSVWYHIADTLLVAEDLTKETTPALAYRLHAIANSIRARIDLSNCFGDDCSKPTKKVCEYWYPIIVPMSTGKSVVMSTIMTCGKFVEAPNECYKGENR